MKKYLIPIVSLSFTLIVVFFTYNNYIKVPNIEDLPFEYLTTFEIESILEEKYTIDKITILEDYQVYDDEFVYESRYYQFSEGDNENKLFECIVSYYMSQDNHGNYKIAYDLIDNYSMNKSIELVESFFTSDKILNDIYYYDNVMIEFSSHSDFKNKVEKVKSFYDYLNSNNINYPVSIKFVSKYIPYDINALVTSNIETMVNGFTTISIDEIIDYYPGFLLENGLYYDDNLKLDPGSYAIKFNTNKSFPTLYLNDSNDSFYYDEMVTNGMPGNLYLIAKNLKLDIKGNSRDFTITTLDGSLHRFVIESFENPFNRRDEMYDLIHLTEYTHDYSSVVKNCSYAYYIDGVQELLGIDILNYDYLYSVFNITTFILEKSIPNDKYLITDFEYLINESDLLKFSEFIK